MIFYLIGIFVLYYLLNYIYINFQYYSLSTVNIPNVNVNVPIVNVPNVIVPTVNVPNVIVPTVPTVNLRDTQIVKVPLIKTVKFHIDKSTLLNKKIYVRRPLRDYGYVYFVTEEPFTNRVKIGTSMNPANKLLQLQAGNPNTLFVYCVIKTPEYIKLAENLHEILCNYKISRDWFKLTLDDIKQIKRNVVFC